MTTTATEQLPLLERARQAAEKRDRDNEAARFKQREEEDGVARNNLVHELQARLGVEVDPDEVMFEDEPFEVMRGAWASVEGVVFGILWRHGHRFLAIERRCSRCQRSVWVELGWNWLSSLYDLLGRADHVHSHDCLVKYDSDGEPTTDRDGKPLPLFPVEGAVAKKASAGERLVELVREIVREEVGYGDGNA